MNTLRTFIITIVAITIIANAASMIMPEGKIKKYGSFIISLIMTLVIITAAIGIIKKGADGQVGLSLDEFKLNEEAVALRYNDNVNYVFDAKIKQEIQKLIEGKNIEIISVKTKLNFDNGEIEKMELEITGDRQNLTELIINKFKVRREQIIINSTSDENGDKNG